MITFIRGIIKAITANKEELVRANVGGRGYNEDNEAENYEEFTDREIFGHYGFSSAPPSGAHCLLVQQGQNVYIIASEAAQYKLALNEGEVALYDTFNNKIHLQKDGKILIEATNEITVEAKDVTVNASGDAKINGENVNINSGSKGAARVDDEVEVVVEAQTFLVGAQAGMPNPNPVTLKGKITKSSNSVKIGG